MAESEVDRDARCERLKQFLAELARTGVSQQAVAARVAIPSQYMSDVKTGRRILSELLARRLQQEFGVDHVWLMTGAGTMTPPSVRHAETKSGDTEVVMVPIVGQPIAGDPRSSPAWDGSLVALTGVSAIRARPAAHPYVLRLQDDDPSGRLRAGDLVLISQDTQTDGEVRVLRVRDRLVLARRGKGKTWLQFPKRRLATAGATIVGRCIGIVWAAL